MSVVVHEIVHAAMHQNVGPHGMGYVAGEYLAYALQMEALPESVRHRVLGSIPVGSADGLVFTGVMLHLDALQHSPTDPSSDITVICLFMPPEHVAARRAERQTSAAPSARCSRRSRRSAAAL